MSYRKICTCLYKRASIHIYRPTLISTGLAVEEWHLPCVYEESDVPGWGLQRVSQGLTNGVPEPPGNGSHPSVDRCSSSLMDKFSRRPSLYQAWSMIVRSTWLLALRFAVVTFWGERVGGLCRVLESPASCWYVVVGGTDLGPGPAGVLIP